MWKLLLGFGQVVWLAMVGRQRFVCENYVFLFKRTPIYETLTRSHPLFEFAQCVVTYTPARLKPHQQFGLLIDALPPTLAGMVGDSCFTGSCLDKRASPNTPGQNAFTGCLFNVHDAPHRRHKRESNSLGHTNWRFCGLPPPRVFRVLRTIPLGS